MVLKSYLIGPQQEGLENDIKPFFLPEDAYSDLQDAYIWRGRVKKRFGYALIGGTDLNSRLRLTIGMTDNSGVFLDTVPGKIFAIGQMFSLGTEVFTVSVLGTPGTMLATGAAAVHTYNTTTGQVSITDAAFPNTPVFFYPAQPVMGILQRENTAINVETSIFFDTQFAYTFNGTSFSRLGAMIWTGTNFNFFWNCNYRASDPSTIAFWVVNNNATDLIQYILTGTTTWIALSAAAGVGPQLNSSGTNRYLQTSLVLLPFKDRLVALNTQEITPDSAGTISNYRNRCRYCQNGDPTNASNAWLDDVAGRGGFVDAPTSEAIITAKFIKDHLIVYFERSTWELIYTGNQQFPFRWQQINSELGCESTFSVVGFDTAVIGIGNVGVHTCNGVNVVRIDEKIPFEVFKIHNGNDGPNRVYGIRDYYNELVYWTFPDQTNNPTFPTRVLLYNYRNNTWAFFNDSFTVFGSFQALSDLTWATVQNSYPTWEEWNTPWGSPLYQSANASIVAGNQQGFIMTIISDLPQNSQSLYITNMTPTNSLKVINHNLKTNDYIVIENAQGITSLNGIVVQVVTIIDTNNFTIDTPFSGTYTGGGKIVRVSNIYILTKQFNPGTPVGQQFRFNYVDFLLDRTVNGQVNLEYLVDTAPLSLFPDDVDPGVILGDTILYTKPEDFLTYQIYQDQIWHRYYTQTQSAFIQLQINMNDTQMRDLTISQQPFELHMFIIYVEPQGRIIG